MLRNRHIEVKMVKDAPSNDDPTLVDAIRAMSPEELEEASKRLMKRAAITFGVVIVTRIAVTLAAEVIANAVEYKLSSKS